MKFREMARGRIFVIRLDDGDNVKQAVEGFARDHGVKNAVCTMDGNVAAGSTFVVGLADSGAAYEPLVYRVENNAEFFGFGTVVLDAVGEPVMHLHGSVGRNGRAVTGCFRENVRVWVSMEIILEEIIGDGLTREYDPVLGIRGLEIKD